MTEQLSLGITIPPDLVWEAVCSGEPAVEHDPRYRELLGEARAAFWRAVHDVVMSMPGPRHGPVEVRRG